jgi:hypothetical protein
MGEPRPVTITQDLRQVSGAARPTPAARINIVPEFIKVDEMNGLSGIGVFAR